MEIKTHYSASELAALKLNSLPSAVKNILAKAERDGWQARKRAGRGGGFEYALSSLPSITQSELKQRQATVLLAQAAPQITPSPRMQALAHREKQLALTLCTIEQLNDTQRAIAEARCALVSEVLKVTQVLGKKKAAAHVAQAAQLHQLPDLLQQLVDRANAKGNGDRTVSSRTLLRWCAAFESTDSPVERLRRLAPQLRQPMAALPQWLGPFLAAYRHPSKPPLSEAYRQFAQHLNANGEVPPSEHAVRRALKKLPPNVLYQGRHTGAALAAKLPFVRRDWSQLTPGDVWIGDGHGMKCKVLSPDTGKPQQMEVTMIMDGASRLVVGWSIALSENVLAVADALRHGMTHYPAPLIYYSDNGAGETGKVLDAPLTGILPRLGIHHETGIPGNPQGRGIIERAWQTITLPLARQYATYQGKSADSDTLRLVNRDISRALTVIKNTTSGAMLELPHVPSLRQFIDDLNAAIQAYNLRPHSSLPRRNGLNMAPLDYWQAHCRADAAPLCAIELQDLFRPAFTRTARRGEIQLWNNVYFARELMQVDGQEVQVGVDVHDPAQVIVRDMAGRFVCVAEVDGNKRAAFPVSLRDKLLQDRVQGQVKRAEDKAELARATLRPALQLTAGEVLPGISGKDISGAFERLGETVPSPPQNPPAQGFVVPQDAAERMALHQHLQALAATGEPLSEHQQRWLSSYPKSSEYRVLSQNRLSAASA